jgi:hypothetical protein
MGDLRSARRRLHGVYLRELIEKLDPLDVSPEMDVGLRGMVDRRLHARQGDVYRLGVAMELAE